MDAPLPPIIHPDVSDLLQNRSTELYKLLDLAGSPYHIVFPQIMLDVASRFRSTLDTTGAGGQLYFAAKANMSNAFLAASAQCELGVDASSLYEFRAALDQGVIGPKISVSGPTKPPELLTLAILHNARITVDEPSEIESIEALRVHLPGNRKVHISLRLSSSDTSRFGMTEQTIDEAFNRLKELRAGIQLDGFSFHDSDYESSSRELMIGTACDAIRRAHAVGLSPTRINIGGGFRTAYANPDDWSLERATERTFVGGGKPTFIYPYATQPAGYNQLADILKVSEETLASTSEQVGSHIAVDAEPGRSLLDQAGISVFRVRAVRPIGEHWAIVVDGNSRQLAEFWRGSEFFIDPILLTDRDADNEPFAAAIASNTCLESDYLARRLIPFRTKPAPGDLLVYVNTAGYQMDSKESDFHRLPIPHKIVAIKNGGDWHFINDHRIGVTDLISDKS